MRTSCALVPLLAASSLGTARAATTRAAVGGARRADSTRLLSSTPGAPSDAPTFDLK